MRIQIYQNGEVHVPDPLLGFVGETNHREVTFDFQNITGATAYALRIDYSDWSYSVPIIGKKFTVTGSMLPEAGKVKAQWLAYASTEENNETVYTLVAKSRIFELEIGESLGDDVEPIPPYEKSVEAAERLIQVGENFEQGYVTELREFINQKNFSVGVGTFAEIAAAEQAGTIPDHALVIPTDGSDVEDFEQVLEDITTLKAATADSGWQDVTMTSPWISGSITLKCRKIGKTVYLRGRAELPTGSTETHLVGTVPEGFRPPNSGAYGMVFTVDGYMFSPCIVQATGVIQVNKLISTTAPATEQSFVGKTLAFDLTYLVAEG